MDFPWVSGSAAKLVKITKFNYLESNRLLVVWNIAIYKEVEYKYNQPHIVCSSRMQICPRLMKWIRESGNHSEAAYSGE